MFFQFNGQTRNLLIKDNSVKVLKASNYKIANENEVGAPLQGKLIKVYVKEGDSVVKNQPLFVIEAMKMESTIVATKDTVIKKLYLSENTMVEQDDCIVSFV